MKALIGFLWIAIIIGNGWVIAKRARRNQEVQSNGHPVKDNFLLLGSGILLAGLMFLAIWWTDRLGLDRLAAKYAVMLPILAAAAGLTWLANSFLRR